MTVLISSSLVILSLLVVSQAADLNCKNLTKPLVVEDEQTVIGRWIISEGITNNPILGNVFKTINSSWMEFAPSTLRDTLVLSQAGMIHAGCQFSSTNITFKNGTFHASVHNITAVINVLPSCSDCLTLSFSRQTDSDTMRSLYLLTKEPKAPESGVEMYRKQAGCLELKGEPQFSYDGVTEQCDQTDVSESQTKPEPEKNDK